MSTENSMDYEKAYNSLLDSFKEQGAELEMRFFDVKKLERSNDKLNEIIHHQNVIISGYKDVTFKLERRINELEKKLGWD